MDTLIMVLGKVGQHTYDRSIFKEQSRRLYATKFIAALMWRVIGALIVMRLLAKYAPIVLFYLSVLGTALMITFFVLVIVYAIEMMVIHVIDRVRGAK